MNIPFSKYLEAVAEAVRKVEEEVELEGQEIDFGKEFERPKPKKGTKPDKVLKLFIDNKSRHFSYEEISQTTGVVYNSVVGSVHMLRNLGWIRRSNGHSNPAKYTLIK